MRFKQPRSLLSCMQIISGTALTAAAFGFFIVPEGFAAGGITGLARLLGYVLPLPLSVLVYMITIPVFVIGWLCVGWEFVGKTLTVSLLFPVFLEGFSRIPIPGLGMGSGTLLAGLLLGFGSVLVLRGNASSGGFDTLAVALNRKHGTPVAQVVRICDCSVILLQSLGQPLGNTVAGILVILISTTVMNHFTGRSSHSCDHEFVDFRCTKCGYFDTAASDAHHAEIASNPCPYCGKAWMNEQNPNGCIRCDVSSTHCYICGADVPINTCHSH